MDNLNRRENGREERPGEFLGPDAASGTIGIYACVIRPEFEREAIAHSPDSFNGIEAGFRVQFPPQSANKNLYDVAVSLDVFLINVLSELGLADNGVRVHQQVLQDLEFIGSQIDFLFSDRDSLTLEVHGKWSKLHF